jgi:hypothetical protein
MFQGMTSNDIVSSKRGGTLVCRTRHVCLSVITTLLIYLATVGGLYVYSADRPIQYTQRLGRAQVTGVLLAAIPWAWRSSSDPALDIVDSPHLLAGALGAVLLAAPAWACCTGSRSARVGRRWRALAGAMHVPPILATLYLPVSLLVYSSKLMISVSLICRLSSSSRGDGVALFTSATPTYLVDGTPAPRVGATGPWNLARCWRWSPLPRFISRWPSIYSPCGWRQHRVLTCSRPSWLKLLPRHVPRRRDGVVGLSILMLDGIMALGRLGNGRR